jgi:hypothetical protein
MPTPEGTEFYSNYCKALDWAKSIIPPVPENRRRHLDYKTNLELLLSENYVQQLIKTSKHKELFAQLDTISEAWALIEVFNKFGSSAKVVGSLEAF